MPMLNRSSRYNYEKEPHTTSGALIASMTEKIHDSIQYAIQDILMDMIITNFLSFMQFGRLKIKVGTSEFLPYILL
jgi:hypothetical protein